MDAAGATRDFALRQVVGRPKVSNLPSDFRSIRCGIEGGQHLDSGFTADERIPEPVDTGAERRHASHPGHHYPATRRLFSAYGFVQPPTPQPSLTVVFDILLRDYFLVSAP